MRVIAGEGRGRPLNAPPGAATRPTSDRVREALFSILGARIPGARVLDLFAGSGALGIEALSRGAAQALFVDDAAAAVKAIRAQLGARPGGRGTGPRGGAVGGGAGGRAAGPVGSPAAARGRAPKDVLVFLAPP